MAISTSTYHLYRNGVLVAQGPMLGSTTFSYTPPDAAAANYECRYNIPNATPGTPGTLFRRSMQITVQKR